MGWVGGLKQYQMLHVLRGWMAGWFEAILNATRFEGVVGWSEAILNVTRFEGACGWSEAILNAIRFFEV